MKNLRKIYYSITLCKTFKLKHTKKPTVIDNRSKIIMAIATYCNL